MVGRVARREMLEMVRDGRFQTSAAILGALLVASLVAGWAHTRAVRDQHAAAAAVQRDLWLEKGEMNPHSAAHYGAFAFKPISEVATIDPGLEPYVGVSVFLEAHRRNLDAFRPADDATPLKRLGDLTVATTLQLLVPLFIIALSFSTFAGEREQGTLRQVLATGASRRALVWGKLLGLSVPVLAVVGLAAAGGVAALALLGQSGLQTLPRALGLVAVYAGYFVGWLAAAVGVSALAASSRVALTVLLALWFFNGFLAPRAASAVARALVPVPSAPELQQGIDADLQRLTPWDTLVQQTTAALLAQHGVARPEDLPVNPEGIALTRGEEADTAVYERHYGRLADIHQRQARAVQWGGVIAPVLAVQSASMSLAGTDHAHHRDFLQAAERYRTAYVGTLNDAVVNQRDRQATWQFMQGRDLWDDVPPFAYSMPPTSWAVRHSRAALAIVLAWALGMLGFAGWAAARTRVH